MRNIERHAPHCSREHGRGEECHSPEIPLGPDTWAAAWVMYGPEEPWLNLDNAPGTILTKQEAVAFARAVLTYFDEDGVAQQSVAA